MSIIIAMLSDSQSVNKIQATQRMTGQAVTKKCFVKVDRESCSCAFLLRRKIIQIVLLLLLVYSPAFSFMSWWIWQLRHFLEWRLGEFRDVKKHCISYPTESLIFCKLLLFFQNKARNADSS